MKKSFVLLTLSLLVFTGINAQERTRFGLVGGLNISKLTNLLMDSRVGFHLGAKMEAPIPGDNDLYVDIEALLSLKGAKVESPGGAELKMNPYYLEIPVHLGYKYEANENLSVFGSAGPYFAIGLFGKYDVDATSVGAGSDSGDFFGDDGFKRFDIGLGLKGGIEIKKTVQISLGYDLGLFDTLGEEGYDSVQNRNFKVSLAYLF